MFWLLLRSVHPETSTSPVPCSASEQVHNKLGGSTARTANLNWPKDIPYQRMSCALYKLWGIGHEGTVAAWGWVEHQLVGCEQLYCAPRVFLEVYSSLLLLFITITIIIGAVIIYFTSIFRLFLSQPTTGGKGKSVSCCLVLSWQLRSKHYSIYHNSLG